MGNKLAAALVAVVTSTLPLADALPLGTHEFFVSDHPADESGWHAISKDARLGISGSSLVLKGKWEARINLAEDEPANFIRGACLGREGTSFAVHLAPVRAVVSSPAIIAVRGPERQYIFRKKTTEKECVIISQLMAVSRSGRYVMANVGIGGEVTPNAIRYKPTILDAETGNFISREAVNDWVDYSGK